MSQPTLWDEPVDTRRAALESVDTTRLRREVLAAYQSQGEMTPDECAHTLGESILSIRPRCTELLKAGLLVATKQRRENRSGRKARVLRAA